MVDQREELSRSAPPRVFEEILRLLRGGAAQRSIYLAWDVGVLGIVLPELCAHLEDRADGADELWDRLRAVDALKAEGRLPSDAVLIASLLYAPMHEAVSGERDPAGAFEEFFEEMVERLTLPRRMRDRMRLIFAAQRRIESGRTAMLHKREFWQDAVTLYEVRCRAVGKPLPSGLGVGETKRRKRRR
jgi:poly(A) polymerase